MMLRLFRALFGFGLVTSALSSCAPQDTCHVTKPNMLNVHLVPHTHDDVGWLKTVDQYYYGSLKRITGVGVQYILDSVVDALLADPDKRFIYVETAFFWRWWREQPEARKAQVQSLVQTGRLEFIGGGWCMNDEAATHYNAIIDQMSWGFRRLNDTFGSCGRPTIAWQIDPFGHSIEQASLFAQMGFEGLFFGRLDYADKDNRVKEKSLELIWQASQSLGRSSDLFTGALYNGYGPPDGFCWDTYCQDDPIMDDPRMEDYNADAVVRKFTLAAFDWSKAYATNHILMPMGSDFHYTNANRWYKNLDKLIRLVNARQSQGGSLNLLYSTPSCYLKALHEAGRNWTTKTDDFFPYASDPHAYWTGYFTSRPALKDMVRRGNNLLQICKQLATFASLIQKEPAYDDRVTQMREAMGVLQHHDAVSGTAKQAVTFDYAMRLARGVTACEEVVSGTLATLIGAKVAKAQPPEQKQPSTVPKLRFCRMLNVSECDVTENAKRFTVYLYNPLTRPVTRIVRLPVIQPGLEVRDSQGALITTQIVPISRPVQLIPGRRSSAAFELVFRADLPALGFNSYYVQRSADPLVASKQLSTAVKITKATSFGHPKLGVSVDSRGRLRKLRSAGQSTSILHTFAYYESHPGHNAFSADRASGAYIFRPLQQRPHTLPVKGDSTLFRGAVVEELHVDYAMNVSEVVRVYADSSDLETDYVVGPIPISDGKGKEIVTRYSTSLKSQSTFFTDSNGRQLVERQKNSRPTWKLNLTEPVAANYYPVNSRIGVRDARSMQHLTVLTDRSQGGSSLSEGSMELMLHRRMLFDDAFGVGEALNEQAFGQGLVIRGQHWLQLTRGSDQASREHRFKAQQLFMNSWMAFSETNLDFTDWQRLHTLDTSMLAPNALPDNVHLLTLEPWTANGEDKYLVRFEHLFEADENKELSKKVSFDLRHFLQDFTVTSVREVSLGANMDEASMNRMEWNTLERNDIFVQKRQEKTTSPNDKFVVVLEPMQIRTYIVDLAPSYRQ